MLKNCMELTGNEHMIVTKNLVLLIAIFRLNFWLQFLLLLQIWYDYKDGLFSIIISLKTSNFLMQLDYKIGFLHLL